MFTGLFHGEQLNTIEGCLKKSDQMDHGNYDDTVITNGQQYGCPTYTHTNAQVCGTAESAYLLYNRCHTMTSVHATI